MVLASSRLWSLPNTLVGMLSHTRVNPGAESNPFTMRSIMGIVRMFGVQSVWFLAVVIRGHCNPLLVMGRMWTE